MFFFPVFSNTHIFDEIQAVKLQGHCFCDLNENIHFRHFCHFVFGNERWIINKKAKKKTPPKSKFLLMWWAQTYLLPCWVDHSLISCNAGVLVITVSLSWYLKPILFPQILQLLQNGRAAISRGLTVSPSTGSQACRRPDDHNTKIKITSYIYINYKTSICCLCASWHD